MSARLSIKHRETSAGRYVEEPRARGSKANFHYTVRMDVHGGKTCPLFVCVSIHHNLAAIELSLATDQPVDFSAATAAVEVQQQQQRLSADK